MSIVLSLSCSFIITFFFIEMANEIKVKKKTQDRKTNIIVGFHSVGRVSDFERGVYFYATRAGCKIFPLVREIRNLTFIGEFNHVNLGAQ